MVIGGGLSTVLGGIQEQPRSEPLESGPTLLVGGGLKSQTLANQTLKSNLLSRGPTEKNDI